MIKRTMKERTNSSRGGLSKAKSSKSQPTLINSSLDGIQSEKPAPARPLVSKAAPAAPKAHLEFIKPDAKNVCVAGSFNGWNPAKTPLTRLTDGKWVGDLTGITGRHEYLFVVDGQWLPDPNARESVQNPFGGRNSVLVVSA